MHDLGGYRGVGRDDHRREALVLTVGVLADLRSAPSGVCPTAAEEMLIPWLPKIVPTRPIMPGRSA